MQSVMLATAGILLTLGTAVCFYLIWAPSQDYGASLAWFMFFIPGIVAYYRPLLCKRIGSLAFFWLAAFSMSFPMTWIIAKSGLPLVFYALAAAVGLFILSFYRGLRVQHCPTVSQITGLMFVCVIVAVFLEISFAIFNGSIPSMFFTFGVAAVIFGLYNVHDVYQFMKKYPPYSGHRQKEIYNDIYEKALLLYLNFFGMLFIADFMKFLIRVIIDFPPKKSVSS